MKNHKEASYYIKRMCSQIEFQATNNFHQLNAMLLWIRRFQDLNVISKTKLQVKCDKTWTLMELEIELNMAMSHYQIEAHELIHNSPEMHNTPKFYETHVSQKRCPHLVLTFRKC